jgi:hypothetical protein
MMSGSPPLAYHRQVVRSPHGSPRPIGGCAEASATSVWVDAQGRVRRMQLSIAAGAPGAATGVSGTITMDFTSYGPVPPIIPPPAGEVFNAGALTAAGIASGQGG